MSPQEPTLRTRLEDDLKAAMRARDRRRVEALRYILSGIKQKEVDERTALDDAGLLALLDKMVKQRKDSVEQYERGGRADLAEQERYEIEILQAYLPEPASEAEIERLIDEALAVTGASSVREMGKVMGVLKPRLQGRADMGAVSARVKAKLSS